MSSSDRLRLDWCSYDATRFACRVWHYARNLPAAKRVQIGVWECGRFIGCVVFSRGACPNIAASFGLTQAAVCELTRVALAPHQAPTSKIVATALRMLRRQSPGVRLVVSYADPAHGHHGGIYQATNWLYVGLTHREAMLRVRGRAAHGRTVSSRFGTRALGWVREHVDPHAERIVVPAKHKYLYPFDPGLRAQLLPLVQPYPKRERSAENGTAGPPAGGGVIPTRSLHHEAAHGG
jgi:hypothetical protein